MYVTTGQRKGPLLADFSYRCQISRNVGKFHTKTDYSKGTKQEKDSNKQLEIFIFKTQKYKTKPLATVCIRRKKNDYIAIFTKSRLQIKFIVFPTNNQP